MISRLQLSKILAGSAIAVLSAALTGCIDEDMADCGSDATIIYSEHLSVDVDNVISTELSDPSLRDVAEALRSGLSEVFSPVMRDLDVAFFHQTDDPSAKAVAHETHSPGTHTGTFTFYMKNGTYRHHAIANAASEQTVDMSGAGVLGEACLTVNAPDVHTVGVFTGRADLQVDSKEKVYEVNLYQVNAAVAVVLDVSECHPTDISVVNSGFASSFAVNDSVFTMPSKPLEVAARDLGLYGNNRIFVTVTLPSADEPGRFTDPNACWESVIQIKNANQSITQTVLSVSTPLRAGHLRVIKARLTADGEANVQQSDVGVSVELDWKPGGTYDPEL